MSTAFVPAPFPNPVIAPRTVSMFRYSSYISASQYRFHPTSVATQGLVPKTANPQADSTASLAEQIAEASAWVDDFCYHRGDGSFSAGLTNEQMTVQMKPGGRLVLICNFRPVLEVVGVALGTSPSQLTNMDPVTAQDIVIGEKTITLPGYWSSGMKAPVPFLRGYPTVSGNVLCVYTYVNGFPHTMLSADAALGATSITVAPSAPGGSALYGAYPGTPLVIEDGPSTETVVVASRPTGLTVPLATPLVYAHNTPAPPDATMVTALPPSIKRATVYVTNFLIKSQGMRAQVPAAIGGATPAQRQAMGRAGTLHDWDAACHLLKIWRTTYLHA